MQNDNSGKLSLGEKVGYSLGDMASNLFFQTFIWFLLIYYTDVFGLTARDAGTLFLVARIIDAIFDPIMGILADRTSTRWGKFRPYLLWFALPFGVIGVLTFTTPDFEYANKLIYAYITYTAMMMVYSVVNVPYSALMGVLTPNSMERTSVSSYRFVSAFIGGMIIQGSTLKLVTFFGGEDTALGWQLTMAAYSVLAVILLLLTFATTRERITPMTGPRNPLMTDLGDLLTNKPYILIGLATIFQLTYICTRGAVAMYYFKYYVQIPEMSFFGTTHQFTVDGVASAFMLFGTIVTVIGAVTTQWFSKRMGKNVCYYAFLGLSALATALLFYVGPSSIFLMFALHAVTSFAFGPVSVLQWAMYTDTADYSEWKTGRRATALIMAASLFALKLGVALGGAVAAYILDWYGYVENVAQTPHALDGIRMTMSVYAAIPAVIGVVIMFFYPLSNQFMQQIEVDLDERRKKHLPANS